MSDKKLSAKRELFVNEYLKCFNSSQAARVAKYANPGQEGYRLLKNDEIAARVRERLNESAMEADEVLFHLATIARGDMNDLLTDNGLPDILTAREQGKTNLIKKWKFRTVTTTDKGGDGSDIHEVEVEPYDRLKALEILAKVHQLTTTSKLQIEDWRSEAVNDIQSGKINFDDLAKAFDVDLATDLFTKAGVPISLG